MKVIVATRASIVVWRSDYCARAVNIDVGKEVAAYLIDLRASKR